MPSSARGRAALPDKAANPALKGVRSAGALRIVQLVVGLASVAVLAPILGPAAYGVFGLAMSMMVFGQLFSSVWGGAYVAAPDVEPSDFDALAWMSSGAGLAAAALLIAVAPVISRFDGFTGSAALLPVLSIVLVLNGPLTFLTAEAQRQRRFDLLAQTEAVSAGLALVTGVSMALSGYGVWSLAGMELTRHLFRVGVLAVTIRRVPGWRCKRQNFAAMLQFDGTRLTGKIIQWADQYLPLLVIARLFGEEALGFYVLGWTVFSRIKEAVVGPFAMFAMPAVAAAKRNKARIVRLLETWQRLSVFLAYPVVIGFVLVCPMLVTIWLGERWDGVAVVMQVLVLSGLRSASGAFNGAVMDGMGRPGLQLKVYGAGLLATLLLLPLGAMAGVTGIAAATLVRGWLVWPLGAHYVETLTGYPAARQFTVALPALLVSGVMAIAVISLQMVWPPMPAVWPLLVASIVTGAIVYIVCAQMWMRESLSGIIALVRGGGGPVRLARGPAE